MAKFEAPHHEIDDERRAMLEDPKRINRGAPAADFGRERTGPNLDEVAVYTFPEVVTEAGGPLVFRGSLREAQEARRVILETARTRTEKISKTAGRLAVVGEQVPEEDNPASAREEIAA